MGVIEANLAKKLFNKKFKKKKVYLSKKSIEEFAYDTLSLIFPQIGNESFSSAKELKFSILKTKKQLYSILECIELDFPNKRLKKDQISNRFFSSLGAIEEKLSTDAKYIFEQDPAAQSVTEVIICYPGFWAIAIFRIAHEIYKLKVPLFPRILTEIAHERTGIDIHPGANIGCPFMIDHGSGIVIGESSTIGSKVKIFQGVTLGGLSVEKNLKDTKRHPTVKDGCTIYSNATLLGGKTIIGQNTIIGGNVWLTGSVPKNSIVYHRSEIALRDKAEDITEDQSFITPN